MNIKAVALALLLAAAPAFAADIDGKWTGAGPTTFNYTGEVSATDLKLNTSFMDTPIEIKLKKV